MWLRKRFKLIYRLLGGRRLPFHPFTEERWRKWHFLVLSEEEGTLPSF